MALNLKELSARKEVFTGGHRMCAGCGGPVAVRQILLAAPQDTNIVVCNPTGCMEVSTTMYPYTSWRTSYIHSAFENAASTLSGVETAYNSLKAQGKLKDNYHFIAFGGDGGTYDIGFQALSGALERGHRLIYVCYNNEAYMNTGIQRSGATPYGAWSTTSPAGSKSFGKSQNRKDLTAIIAAHNIPYVAQASIHNWKDITQKAQKAFASDGPAFINVIAPCHRGWRYPMGDTIKLARLAFETCFWPLYEVENGRWKLTAKPKEKKPVADFLKKQGRFRHLFQPGNEEQLENIQAFVDKEWDLLLKRCQE